MKYKEKDPTLNKVFAMRCCTPKFLFRRLLEDNPVSIMITSGTLSPIDSLEGDLGVPFA